MSGFTGGCRRRDIYPKYMTNPSSYGDNSRIGWVWLILPYMEQTNISDQYHFDCVWFDPTLQPVVTARLSVMECPSDPVAGNIFPGSNTDPISGKTINFRAAACDYFATVSLNSNASQLGWTPCQDEKYTSVNNSNYDYLVQCKTTRSQRPRRFPMERRTQ